MEKVCIGFVLKPHGIKGAVYIKTLLEDPMLFKTFKAITNEKNELVEIKPISRNQDVILAYIAGIHTRNEAQDLKGQKFFIDKAELPKLSQENTFYQLDLIGLKVMQNGNLYGKVKSIENYGAGDIIVIEKNNHKEALFSFSNRTFPVVDIQNGFIEINEPDLEKTENES